MPNLPISPDRETADKAFAEMTEGSRLAMPSRTALATTAESAVRQMGRALSEMEMIRDDVRDGEWDGARSHIEILRRQLADLDEKLLAAVAAEAE